MANRDSLADAIADAKAVKEVAIANAKAALEEAFTPHLKDMLAQKINEMEDMDEEMDLAEVDKEKVDEEKEMDEGYGKKDMDEGEDMDEGYGKKDMDEAEDMDEELDLEEILAELELEEEEIEEQTSEPHGNIGAKTPEGEPLGFLEEEIEEGKTEDVEEGYDKVDEAEEVEADEAEEEINLEDMSEDDLKSMIEDVIEDMIEDGELVPGPNADESEEEEAADTDDGTEGDADVDIEVDDIDLQEGKEEVNELDLSGSVEALPNVAAIVSFLAGALGVPAAVLASMSLGDLKDMLKGAMGKKMEEGEKEAMEETIQTLRSDLNEVNLLNSKLLYTNKIFRGKNLTENQKIKVLKAFDKAETVKQAKTIYETLNENLVAKTKKSNIRESLGAASKPAGVAPKRALNENVVQEDAMVARFKQLAGIQ